MHDGGLATERAPEAATVRERAPATVPAAHATRSGIPASPRGEALLRQVRDDFIGLNTQYETVDGRRGVRRFLDSAASTLMMRAAWRTAAACLEHYSNTHSFTHFSARISTELYAWAHARMLSFFLADAARYACVFTGTGSTAGFNRIARMFRELNAGRDTVLVSLMEHHSNDLPHRKHHANVVSIPCEGEGDALGALDLAALRRLLETHRGRVSYVAVTAASNVTGIINPVNRIARIAHEYDVSVVVDASQLAAHQAINVGANDDPREDIDVLVFSGHKVYAPGSPGVVIARRDLLQRLEPSEVGGGMVDHVSLEGYSVCPALPDREEAGTPNIPGAIRLAAAVEVLDRIGMQLVFDHEARLTRRLLRGLQSIPQVRLYGDTDVARVPRTPTVVLNVEGVEHALLAAILNDYFNIAVRNECFCAQPYVREMIREELWDLDVDGENHLEALVAARLGMVRVSLGLYSREEDVDALVAALREIVRRRESFAARYEADGKGGYRHVGVELRGRDLLDPMRVIDASLAHMRPAPAGY